MRHVRYIFRQLIILACLFTPWNSGYGNRVSPDKACLAPASGFDSEPAFCLLASEPVLQDRKMMTLFQGVYLRIYKLLLERPSTHPLEPTDIKIVSRKQRLEKGLAELKKVLPSEDLYRKFEELIRIMFKLNVVCFLEAAPEEVQRAHQLIDELNPYFIAQGIFLYGTAWWDRNYDYHTCPPVQAYSVVPLRIVIRKSYRIGKKTITSLLLDSFRGYESHGYAGWIHDVFIPFYGKKIGDTAISLLPRARYRIRRVKQQLTGNIFPGAVIETHTMHILKGDLQSEFAVYGAKIRRNLTGSVHAIESSQTQSLLPGPQRVINQKQGVTTIGSDRPEQSPRVPLSRLAIIAVRDIEAHEIFHCVEEELARLSGIPKLEGSEAETFCVLGSLMHSPLIRLHLFEVVVDAAGSTTSSSRGSSAVAYVNIVAEITAQLGMMKTERLDEIMARLLDPDMTLWKETIDKVKDLDDETIREAIRKIFRRRYGGRLEQMAVEHVKKSGLATSRFFSDIADKSGKALPPAGKVLETIGDPVPVQDSA